MNKLKTIVIFTALVIVMVLAITKPLPDGDKELQHRDYIEQQMSTR